MVGEDAQRQPLTVLHWGVLALAAAAYVVCGALYIYRTSFVWDSERVFCLWDDGMIAMHYARNLARGDGLVWNPGQPPVQGFTNLGVTLVMTLVHWLPVGTNRAALVFQALNLALLTATVGYVFGLARRVAPSAPSVAFAATLATMACAPLGVWALQGADTGFVALWLTSTLYAAAHPRQRWPIWLYAWMGLGLLIRADVALLYGVVGACFAVGSRRRAAGLALVLVAVLSGIVALNQGYYDDPLPNTYYLKATGSPRALVLQSGWSQLQSWLPWLVPALGAGGLAVSRRRDKPPLVAAAAVVMVALVYTVWVGGDWAPQWGNRFFAPTLPLLFVLSAMGLHPLVERAFVDWTAVSRSWALGLAATALAAFGNPSRASKEWFSTDEPTMYRSYNARNHERAMYLAAHTDAQTVVAVQWAGVPIYFSDRPAVDVLGKSDRHIAKMTVTRFSPGHSKWDWDYILGTRKPDVLLTRSRGLGAQPLFQTEYVVVVDGELELFIRRDALSKLHAPHATVHDVAGENLAP